MPALYGYLLLLPTLVCLSFILQSDLYIGLPIHCPTQTLTMTIR